MYRRPSWVEIGFVTPVVIAALGFLVSGTMAGVVLLLIAVGIGIVLWTPMRDRLGIPGAPVSDEHREELQIIAASVSGGIKGEWNTLYRMDGVMTYPARWSSGRKISPQVAERSFREHFPDVSDALDQRRAPIVRIRDAEKAFAQTVAQEWDTRDMCSVMPSAAEYISDLALSGMPLGAPAPSTGLVDRDDGYVGTENWGTVEIANVSDPDAFKRSLDELLQWALESPELAVAKGLYDERGAADEAIGERVSEIRATHVIRGTCELCRG